MQQIMFLFCWSSRATICRSVPLVDFARCNGCRKMCDRLPPYDVDLLIFGACKLMQYRRIIFVNNMIISCGPTIGIFLAVQIEFGMQIAPAHGSGG